MANPSFFIKIGKLTASQMLTLANSVIAGLTASVGTYPAPTPSVATMTTDATALKLAIVNRGRKETYGGALSTATLKNAMETIFADLIGVSQYIMNVTPSSRLDFLAAGFPTYFIHANGFKAKNIQQRARNVRALVRRDIASTQVYLKWKRPLGQHRPPMKSPIVLWRVFRSNTATRSGFSEIALVTKTQYTDNLTGLQVPASGAFFYKVVGYSKDNASVESDIVKVKAITS